MTKIAVILINMGGPDSLGSVKPYLFNLFCDPAIISMPMPRILRKHLAHWLANRRYKKSVYIYKQIGGKSPLLEITNCQCQLLEKRLNKHSTYRFTVFSAMRYWYPKLEDIWYEVVSLGFAKLIIMPLYPFYSTTTSESVMNLIAELNQSRVIKTDDLIIINRFGNHPQFIGAVIYQIRSALEAHPNIKDVLLSAHSIPVKCIKNGDPYLNEIKSAFQQLKIHFYGDLRLHLSFQSKLGPVKWLEPTTTDKICEIANRGVKRLIVYPLGFVAENSETVYELDIQVKKLAHEKGIVDFIRVGALNGNKLFIEALNTMILKKLNVAQP